MIKLWDDLVQEDRTAIAARIGQIRNRTQGTKLGDAGTAATADAIVRTHRVTFVHASYYVETRENASGNLVLNVDLLANCTRGLQACPPWHRQYGFLDNLECLRFLGRSERPDGFLPLLAPI